MRNKAFTLIELLVVIAIIAILAAILFPVFAQAKLAAKKTQALSNTKQLDLSIQMYLNDSDDTYPYAFGSGTWTGTELWEQRIQPYVKNFGIFVSPADSQGGKVANVGSWAGVGVSYAANCYYGGWDGTGFQLRGPMGVIQYTGSYTLGVQNNSAWLHYSQNGASQMTQPADTILFAEKNGDDILKWHGLGIDNTSFNDQGNYSAFAMGGELCGSVTDGIGWGPQKLPNGSIVAANVPANQQFENGPNGAVSVKYSNQSTFSFLDGHAKSMVPAATNPNPNTMASLNKWDGMR